MEERGQRWVEPAAVEGVVTEVNALTVRSSAAMALAAGRLVFERIFGGDEALVERRGRRFVGFRAVAGHPGLDLSRRQLWQAVRLYLLQNDLGAELWGRLGWGQQLALSGAPSASWRTLAEGAFVGGWTARRIAREIVALRPRRGGGPQSPSARAAGPGSDRALVG